ncbi:MAG: dihydropteroate synthase, partial [Phycisphaerales bacterium]|nr:dihydropteroate synthase [Phycisphaerales bacterium]
FVAEDGVNIVGGCCGTTATHLKAVAEAIGARAPKRRSVVSEASVSSLYQAVPMRQDNSFLIVGERCNTNGSRQFKNYLADGNIDGCVSMAIEQVKEEGAHVLDICVDYVGRDGVPDMTRVVDRISREAIAPLMLDSTEPPVIEAGLKLAGGKCIINSVNLEDGEEKLGRIAGLCRQYGAAVVALTIDEDPVEAMAKTADRKLSIAERLHDLLTRKHGLREDDILFDCLTFPVTTGSEADRRLGLETLDGIERVMKRFPRCQSILGLSNISFGLVPAARVVLNSVFLDEARKRGLTAAIVHAAKILPRNQISDERWNAALDLIYDRRDTGDPLERFIGLFSKDEQLGAKTKIADLPIEERLRKRIIDGAKQGFEKDLDEAMQRYSPLEIINTFLLDGMKVVGDLFGAGQMQLPFVLKSAEAMKHAVAHLEKFMEKKEGSSRGSIVLATVRGDVHDIGKNLVDIILTNNGYTVYNIGIKQPINNIIAAWQEKKADAIGMSGLLVKSTLVMRDDLFVLNEQGINVPVILGGAALTRRYVEEDLRPIYHGSLHYAKDAFEGLRLMERICSAAPGQAVRSAAGVGAAQAGGGVHAASNSTARDSIGATAVAAVSDGSARRDAKSRNLELETEQRYGLAEVGETEEDDQAASLVSSGGESTSPAGPRRSNISHAQPVPTPPFWGSRVIDHMPIRAALGHVNEVMLFQVQWGFRKRGRSKEEFKRYIDTEVRPIYRQLVERCERENIITPKAIYGYWPCNSEGDDLILFAPPDSGGGSRREIARFSFPRQKSAPYWCLSDFWRPLSGGVADVVAFQVVTAGERVSHVAREWFAANEYQQYLFLHGLGVEFAEALAEYMHKQIRMELGAAGNDARDIQRLFQQGYQGSRYSFGYPACPRLEDQSILMELLRPERIGVSLSEEYQLDPEQSTTAIVSIHPDARYFNVR